MVDYWYKNWVIQDYRGSATEKFSRLFAKNPKNMFEIHWLLVLDPDVIDTINEIGEALL